MRKFSCHSAWTITRQNNHLPPRQQLNLIMLRQPPQIEIRYFKRDYYENVNAADFLK